MMADGKRYWFPTDGTIMGNGLAMCKMGQINLLPDPTEIMSLVMARNLGASETPASK
jgi:hypothetical protein